MFSFSPTWARLRNGKDVLIRAASKEDFPRWCEMIGTCSVETLWDRFECRSPALIVQRVLHSFGSKEDELILVAEVERRIVGEAWLCAIPGENAAEFCVLVADPWQGLGLGSILTDLALECARKARINRILVEVVPENLRIIRLLSSRGFRFFGDEKNVHHGELRLEPTDLT